MTTGDPNVYPASFPTLSDLTIPTGSNIQVPIEALADRTAYLKAHVGAVAALTFNTVAMTTPTTFNDLKYSDALSRWFGLGTSLDEILTSQQLLVWPVSTDIPVPQRTSNVVGAFDLDTAGNMLAVCNLIDTITKRTAAGVWSIVAGGGEGDATAEPALLFEPVSGAWVLAFQTGGGSVIIRTSTNLFTTHTNRTAPAGLPATAKVSLGHNGAGRIVLQGFNGSNTYFSHSDDGGATWSSVQTLALGVTYDPAGTVGVKHPQPTWNGNAWVAVGGNMPSGLSRVFTSPDGATWAIGPSFTSVGIRRIAGLGGLVVGSTLGPTATSNGLIVFSADNGATWRRTEGAYVLAAGGSGPPRGVVATASRFIVLSASNQVFPGVGFLEGGGLVT